MISTVDVICVLELFYHSRFKEVKQRNLRRKIDHDEVETYFKGF